MFSDRIPDDRITASSWLSAKHLPRYGRLDRNMGHGAWCSARNDAQPYLEIDVEIEHMITGIIIQGKHRLSSDKLGFAWVTEFSLSFTANRKNWTFVTDVKSSQPIVSKISRTEMSYLKLILFQDLQPGKALTARLLFPNNRKNMPQSAHSQRAGPHHQPCKTRVSPSSGRFESNQ